MQNLFRQICIFADQINHAKHLLFEFYIFIILNKPLNLNFVEEKKTFCIN